MPIIYAVLLMIDGNMKFANQILFQLVQYSIACSEELPT